MVQANVIDKVTCRFNINKQISVGDFAVESASAAGFSPVAKKLFGFPWVDKIRVGPNFVELSKKDWVEWDVIVEPLMGLLEEHFSTATQMEEPLPTPKTSAVASTGSAEMDSINAFLENQINPSLAMHGGFVELKSFENNAAFMSMGGGCQGCASSQATMFDGIQNALKNEFPFVHKVVDVTDHTQGTNPFYAPTSEN
ncbi:MAG: NifU family protein [Bdellovibrionaceae bacterium]|nr:NifU family protein [Pseudobdellovibrionaceae bacterium]